MNLPNEIFKLGSAQHSLGFDVSRPDYDERDAELVGNASCQLRGAWLATSFDV
ncbi:MAG: hypothetical protein WBA38_04290 [Gordonia sp. (in: high G+C Gram-positive bacteria)]|uniref:hypothetical protein n=1 Tax=Gordonia sp. (in: high G+C Gram-positive bacteria) TaxID=84139 RepID=UPI003C77028C